jgi:hypothetical protein
MGTSARATTSSAVYTTPAFWERFWRTGGIQSIACFILAYFIYGDQPRVGTAADALVAFYSGDHARILIAAVFFGLAFSISCSRRRQDHLGGRRLWQGLGGDRLQRRPRSALSSCSSVVASLAYSIAGSDNHTLTSGLNDFAWACVVLSSFPRAMLIMSGAFGLWRAKLISNALFAAGVAAVVLVLLGGTTWLSSGFWAPDGAYSRIVSPVIGLVWMVVVTRVLLAQSPGTRAGW